MTLRDVARALRRDFVLFSAVATVVVLGAVVVALVSRPLYRSEVVIAPVPDDGAGGALGGLAGQFGGLAALAGVSIGKGQSWDEAIALLRSRRMIESLVKQRDLMPVLFEKKWDPGRRAWKQGVTRPPSMGDAVLMFQRRILQVREDAKTGLVTVRIQWHDPAVAADWANTLVQMADRELRDNAIQTSTLSLKALQGELARADAIELRTAIGRLMEQQLKARLLADVRRDFAYRVIDPAVPSDRDKRVQPTRVVMVLAGMVLGVLLGLIAVVAKRDWLGRPGAA
jgi:uncharacterized protein involved in exopolysaccharide biosynthesis